MLIICSMMHETKEKEKKEIEKHKIEIDLTRVRHKKQLNV